MRLAGIALPRYVRMCTTIHIVFNTVLVIIIQTSFVISFHKQYVQNLYTICIQKQTRYMCTIALPP